jgi:hypothetical protein
MTTGIPYFTFSVHSSSSKVSRSSGQAGRHPAMNNGSPQADVAFPCCNTAAKLCSHFKAWIEGVARTKGFRLKRVPPMQLATHAAGQLSTNASRRYLRQCLK